MNNLGFIRTFDSVVCYCTKSVLSLSSKFEVSLHFWWIWPTVRRGGGSLPGSNQGKICSTDIDCVDKDWPGAIVSYIYFTDDAQPSQGVDENNPL